MLRQHPGLIYEHLFSIFIQGVLCHLVVIVHLKNTNNTERLRTQASKTKAAVVEQRTKCWSESFSSVEKERE